MGIVFLGRHARLGRLVAIKELPPTFAADPEVRERFSTEARTLASLSHPHIVPIYDYVERDGLCLIVMEELPGGTVWDRFTTTGLTPPTACAVVVACCAALQHAHDKGVLHLDVKPDNLMFARDTAIKVTDFGISRVLSGDHTLGTVDGQVLGTPAYMSPEQARGSELTPKSDVYSAGVMLYELLSGHLPWAGAESATDLLLKRLREDPRPLPRDRAADSAGPGRRRDEGHPTRARGPLRQRGGLRRRGGGRVRRFVGNGLARPRGRFDRRFRAALDRGAHHHDAARDRARTQHRPDRHSDRRDRPRDDDRWARSNPRARPRRRRLPFPRPTRPRSPGPPRRPHRRHRPPPAPPVSPPEFEMVRAAGSAPRIEGANLNQLDRSAFVDVAQAIGQPHGPALLYALAVVLAVAAVVLAAVLFSPPGFDGHHQGRRRHRRRPRRRREAGLGEDRSFGEPPRQRQGHRTRGLRQPGRIEAHRRRRPRGSDLDRHRKRVRARSRRTCSSTSLPDR